MEMVPKNVFHFFNKMKYILNVRDTVALTDAWYWLLQTLQAHYSMFVDNYNGADFLMLRMFPVGLTDN